MSKIIEFHIYNMESYKHSLVIIATNIHTSGGINYPKITNFQI